MKYLVLDDEIIAAHYIAELIGEIDENAEIVTSNNATEALKIVTQQQFHVCFVDIQMPGLSGIEFAAQVKKIFERTNFIFITGYSEHMGDAFKLDASDYIMKPANVEEIRHALENLRYSTGEEQVEAEKKRIQINCFGNFEIIIDGKPVKFKFEKTKELLAYLVHRKGMRCTSNEVIAALWDDEGHNSYYRMLKKDLQDTLKQLDCKEIIHSERGNIGLSNREAIECDYFKWIENSEEGSRLYHGEYMAQYSWAEDINAIIDMDKYYKE